MPLASACVFVVNPRSGGRAGSRLLHRLRQQLPAERVLAIDGLDLPALARSWRGRAEALVACGGDGTCSGLLDAAWRAAGDGEPTPVAVLPLGTGNDLARVAGVPLDGGLDRWNAWLARARPQPLDRWTLAGPGGERPWFNYCSWGCDARIAGRFHRLREQHGWWLRARLANLAAYAGLGLQEPGAPLPIEVRAGEAPAHWVRSLVLANIPSYAGGRSLGAGIAAGDGRCDAFLLGGGIVFGLGLSGLRRPRRAGAHRRYAIRLRRAVHLQLDGEPLRAPPGEYRVAWAGSVRLLVDA